MVTAIEGVWKHGRVVPLMDVKVEEDTRVIINVLEERKKKDLLAYAGAWKNDDQTYTLFRKVYEDRKNLRLRI